MESMDARKSILESIRQHKPESTDIPDIPDFESPMSNIVFGFGEVAAASGSKVVHIDDRSQLHAVIASNFPEAGSIFSLFDEIPSTFQLNESAAPIDHQGIDLAIIPAELGVAENGAVWVSTQSVHPRILPFICEHLVVLLEKSSIRSNMHEAYKEINLKNIGFGVFIAGPSKTADIEQSLVIGAQGARSHTICLI